METFVLNLWLLMVILQNLKAIGFNVYTCRPILILWGKLIILDFKIA